MGWKNDECEEECSHSTPPNPPTKKRTSRFLPFNKTTIEKWNTKTRLASSQAEKSFKALNKSLVTQIDQVSLGFAEADSCSTIGFLKSVKHPHERNSLPLDSRG